MGHHDKKVYDSLPFKNKAIDTVTITSITGKQHKIAVHNPIVKKDLNKEALKNINGTFSKEAVERFLNKNKNKWGK
jgi:hypothetical protein